MVLEMGKHDLKDTFKLGRKSTPNYSKENNWRWIIMWFFLLICKFQEISFDLKGRILENTLQVNKYSSRKILPLEQSVLGRILFLLQQSEDKTCLTRRCLVTKAIKAQNVYSFFKKQPSGNTKNTEQNYTSMLIQSLFAMMPRPTEINATYSISVSFRTCLRIFISVCSATMLSATFSSHDFIKKSTSYVLISIKNMDTSA